MGLREWVAVLLFAFGVGCIVYVLVLLPVLVEHWRWSRRMRKRIGWYS